MKQSHYIFILLAGFFFLVSPVAHGQEGASTPAAVVSPAPVDQGPEDALGRGNPRGSITGFLEAASDFNWEKAAEYLDLRNVPEEVAELGGPQLARQFNHVLARAVWLDDYSVSDKPEGLQGDDLPSYRDELVTITTDEGVFPLWMQRVPRADGVLVWKVSNRSVALIPELYAEFSYAAPVEKIRGWFPEDVSFLGIEAFKWFILIIVALVCWPVFRLLGVLLSRLFSSPEKEIYPLVRNIFTGPIVFIGILFVLYTILQELGTGAYAQVIMKAHTLATLAIIWASWSAINLVKQHQQMKLTSVGRIGAAKLLQPLTTLLKIIILVFGFLFWLSNLGVNITTVLAGLGVGGLAVALALQKPIEDLMGALTLFSQAPIRVGDFVRYGNEMGEVEEIGLRTTRLRTLTNTVVSIPNARVATTELENLSYRTKIRFWPVLRLSYDTSPEQLRRILERIIHLLKTSERVHDEPLRANFTGFADDAILIKIHSFIKTIDFAEFLNIAEELNFGIMAIVREEGAKFALPGRSIHLEGDPAFIPT